MPVTAKLSRKFYERFGDELTNELVEWFNQVDTAYRSEFRDLFEVHFARFDAKLEQRIAEVKAEFESRFAALEAGFETRFAGLEARLVKWMFLFWVGTVGTLIALQRTALASAADRESAYSYPLTVAIHSISTTRAAP